MLSSTPRLCFRNIINYSVFLLITSAHLASAQSVKGTNDTLPDLETKSSFNLRLNGGPLFDEKSFDVVPLTVAAGKGQNSVAISTYNIQGNFKLGDVPTSIITDSDMAFVCCDPIDPMKNASEIVKLVADQKPQAIILYTKYAMACSHSGDFEYQSFYSMTSKKDSKELLSTAEDRLPSSTPLRVIITPSTMTGFGTPVMDTNNEGGPAPTTAVAMSILYSITGIITLLFLIIIATGAIRAHRHPERYGPRNAGFPGRPRQSRAKGLARAMLETLPIVKFGDPAPLKKNGADNLKYEEHSSYTTNLDNLRIIENEATEEGKTEKKGKLMKSSVESNHYSVESDLGCSICTEDFVPGEDLRVLPCNHKYHPICIDPWLLDVCGTCPLCRHDLRPLANTTSDAGTVTQGLAPPLSAIEETRSFAEDQVLNLRRNRITRFFDLHRLRHAPPAESLAALRQLRQQTRNEMVPSPSTEQVTEERRQSHRLSQRLKETFRVRTRTQSELPMHSV